MLVLSRMRGEAILIGEDIEVRVVAISGDKVRLGVTAPIEVDIDREEIREIINQQPPEDRAARRRA